jgi:hypothetical protein
MGASFSAIYERPLEPEHAIVEKSSPWTINLHYF